MRWSGQSIDREAETRLPGYREPAVERHFEAPEAMDRVFYEVRAKSALNRVPNTSSVPFKWTINPYRGCAHACVYCAVGETPILMADGRTRPLSDLRVGDEIYGTEVRGRSRRYVRTRVLAHWTTDRRAYRTTLAAGTELVTSRDHRFLSERGWKRVAAPERGAPQRPYLTPGDRLIGVGRFATAPEPLAEYRRGHVRGTLRGGGHVSQPVFALAPADAEPLAEIDACLGALAFDTALDRASANRRDIEGRALEAPPWLRVVSVEDLGVVLPMYDITTGTGDFIANGVVSHNCFARPTHEYLDMDAGRDFERRIVVKVNVPEVLRAELARPSWKGEHVALGTNTDPYQWVEGRYKLMRGIWAALRDARNPCSILTKSPLVLRDADLLREIGEVADVSACLSVPTLDEKAWRATEPGTPNPRARLEAVAELNRRGIPTGILIAPLMPGINDAPEQVERIIELATEAGAVSIGGNTLFLTGPVRKIFFEWLRTHRPDLLDRYARLYARGAWAPEAERRRIEHAAGLPGRRLRPYAERFTHRAGAPRRAAEGDRRGPKAGPSGGTGREEAPQGTLF